MSGVVTRPLAPLAIHPLTALLLLLYAIVVLLPAQLKPPTLLIKKQKCKNRAKEEALQRSSEFACTCERRKREDGKGPARTGGSSRKDTSLSSLSLSRRKHDGHDTQLEGGAPRQRAEVASLLSFDGGDERWPPRRHHVDGAERAWAVRGEAGVGGMAQGRARTRCRAERRRRRGGWHDIDMRQSSDG
jgi:hypothetical protein